LRSLPARLRRPETLLMLTALLASLAAHMPPYVGLGALADYFERTESDRAKQKPVEVSFEVSESTPQVAPPEPPEQVPPTPEKWRPNKKKPKPEEKKVAAPEPPPKKPEPEKEVAELELQKPAMPEPPPSIQRKQSITQKSDDPNVEPPPNAEYLAEENRRVEEETVAKITDETKNDPDIQAAAPQAEGPEESGDSHEDERGQEHGGETKEQLPSVARSQQPPAPTLPAQKPSVPKQAPRQELAPQPMIVHDPMGTFVIAPSRAAQRGQAGRTGQEGAPGAAAPNLRVSWSAFEQTYGAEQLAQDRMPKEAKRRGAGREKRWSEFRAAIENYISGVKPGNQTQLNAAADPFAAYLAAFHRNLHTEFVHEFIASLPSSGELADESLVAKVEIVVNPDGTLDRVGVVKSSGNLMYDFGAFNAVQRGAPYPPPPERIRSSDGRTYLRWALHRDQSQCGTWNAEPYILKDPPRSPNDPKQDNVSPYRPGGEQERGRQPKNEPGKGGGDNPAVSPGDTLGGLFRRRRLDPA
jgi:TonB family protein